MDKVRSKTNRISKKGRLGNRLSWLIPSVLLVACFVFLSIPVYAAVFNVASSDVAGLINAINTANSNGQDNTINLAAGTYILTTVDNDTDGPNGLPSISSNLTIEGLGADTTIIERNVNPTIYPSFRIFHVSATGTLNLIRLTVKGGSLFECCDVGGGGIFNNGKLTITNTIVSDNFSRPAGAGGILNNGGTLDINNSILSGNNADFSSGGGGGILNNGGTLDINNSILSRNDAAFTLGGGIVNFNEGTININNTTISGSFAGACSGVLNEGMMTITNTIIDGNLAGAAGAGICNGSVMKINHSTISHGGIFEFGGADGGIINGGNLTITDSEVSNNGSSGTPASLIGAGGIDNAGNLTIINSTIANNSGTHDTGGITNRGNLTITNSTIANNLSAIDGVGGILNETGGTVHLQNTVLALNITNYDFAANPSDCSGQVTSFGNNIIGDTTGCNTPLQSTDLTGDPGLDTFTDNGTPGNGHYPLLSNSQAINAGNNNVCLTNPILATDQIGDPRVGICDIGAIEFELFKNLGDCVSTLIQQNCSRLQGQNRAACIKEQQAVCSNLFEGK